MNLWAKASRLFILIVSTTLFFVACDEDLGNIGTDINGSQFDLIYKEFTLPSHVIIDSANTAQQGLITGSYNDPKFGVVTAEAYTEFAAPNLTNLKSSEIIFDSLVLNLSFNSYNYGSKAVNSLVFEIHEITEEMIDVAENTNYSSVSYDPMALGQGSYTLSPEVHDDLESDTTISIRIDNAYFQRMKDILTSSKTVDGEEVDNTTDDVSPENGFYGFAILTPNSDKVIGVSTSSRLTIHYQTSSVNSLEYSYIVGNRFNRITSDRSGTALEGLTDDNPNTPFTPSDDMRYVQSGTGVTTEIDFQEVLDFFDVETNPELVHMIINSASLSFGEIESTELYSAPLGIILNQTDVESVENSIDIGGNELSHVIADQGGQSLFGLVQEDENDDGTYLNLPTTYFQLLKDQGVERSTVLIRSAFSTTSGIFSAAGQSVDRFVIHKDSIKLKMYYTIPKQ